MTVIQSIAATSTLTIGATCTAPDNVDVGMGEKVGIFRRADLLAALDATANTDVAAKVTALEMARGARDEWQTRAEKAEAKVAAVLETLENADADDLKIRFYNKLIAVLRPAPVFALPTEARVRFEARYGSEWETYTTYADGNGGAIYRGDCGFNDGDYIMRCYTDHRLIGAAS